MNPSEAEIFFYLYGLTPEIPWAISVVVFTASSRCSMFHHEKRTATASLMVQYEKKE